MAIVKLNRKLYELHEKYGKHNQGIAMPNMAESIPITMCTCGGVMYQYNSPSTRCGRIGLHSQYHDYLIDNNLEYLIALNKIHIPGLTDL